MQTHTNTIKYKQPSIWGLYITPNIQAMKLLFFKDYKRNADGAKIRLTKYTDTHITTDKGDTMTHEEFRNGHTFDDYIPYYWNW